MVRNKALILLVLALLLPVFAACHQTATPAPTSLPRTMKGYELYSWQDGGQWHFTLITGTNRNKILGEIISGSDNVTPDGWVDIHVTGVKAIEALLARVPQGEWVSWNAQGFVIPLEEAKAKLALPPENIVNEIKDYVKQFGYTFYVAELQ